MMLIWEWPSCPRAQADIPEGRDEACDDSGRRTYRDTLTSARDPLNCERLIFPTAASSPRCSLLPIERDER